MPCHPRVHNPGRLAPCSCRSDASAASMNEQSVAASSTATAAQPSMSALNISSVQSSPAAAAAAPRAYAGWVTQTQSRLAALVRFPPLKPKLLERPPFAYVHDLLSGMSRRSSVFDSSAGSIPPECWNIHALQAKAARLEFMSRLVAFVEQRAASLSLPTPPAVQPLAVVESRDCEQTGAWLRAVADMALAELRPALSDTDSRLATPHNMRTPAYSTMVTPARHGNDTSAAAAFASPIVIGSPWPPSRPHAAATAAPHSATAALLTPATPAARRALRMPEVSPAQPSPQLQPQFEVPDAAIVAPASATASSTAPSSLDQLPLPPPRSPLAASFAAHATPGAADPAAAADAFGAQPAADDEAKPRALSSADAAAIIIAAAAQLVDAQAAAANADGRATNDALFDQQPSHAEAHFAAAAAMADQHRAFDLVHTANEEELQLFQDQADLVKQEELEQFDQQQLEQSQSESSRQQPEAVLQKRSASPLPASSSQPQPGVPAPAAQKEEKEEQEEDLEFDDPALFLAAVAAEVEDEPLRPTDTELPPPLGAAADVTVAATAAVEDASVVDRALDSSSPRRGQLIPTPPPPPAASSASSSSSAASACTAAVAAANADVTLFVSPSTLRESRHLLGLFVPSSSLASSRLRNPRFALIHEVVLAIMDQTGFGEVIFCSPADPDLDGDAHLLDAASIADDAAAQTQFVARVQRYGLLAALFVGSAAADLEAFQAPVDHLLDSRHPQLAHAFLQALATLSLDTRLDRAQLRTSFDRPACPETLTNAAAAATPAQAQAEAPLPLPQPQQSSNGVAHHQQHEEQAPSSAAAAAAAASSEPESTTAPAANKRSGCCIC